MIQTKGLTSGFTSAFFASAVLIGGANFIAVRFSNEGLAPFWGAGLRFSIAGLIFLAIVVIMRLPWPRGHTLWLTALYGIFSFTLSYALMYWALVQVTAGLAAVILAIVPLVTPLLAAAQKLETLDRRIVLGAIVALGGILWMTVGDVGIVLPLSGLIAMLVASLTIGQSVILGKRIAANHPATTNAVGIAVGAPTLLVISFIAGETWVLPSAPAVVASVAYLSTIGSVGLFVAMLLVVRRWTASASAYAFVLFPVVTMVLEAWLLDVPFTVRGVSGALLVMAGVWFGAIRPSLSGPIGSSRREPVPSTR